MLPTMLMWWIWTWLLCNHSYQFLKHVISSEVQEKSFHTSLFNCLSINNFIQITPTAHLASEAFQRTAHTTGVTKCKYRLQFNKKKSQIIKKLHEGLRVSRLFYLHAFQNGKTFRQMSISAEMEVCLRTILRLMKFYQVPLMSFSELFQQALQHYGTCYQLMSI